MKARRIFAIQYSAVLVTVVLLSSFMVAQEQQRGSDKYLCSEQHPESICNADNTCGSASTPCTVDIKRTSEDASVTPSIPGAKGNQPFCVKSGTTMNWKSSQKNTGFVLDFGPDSPFGTGAIIGGSDRSPSSTPKKKGCYKYSAGACVSGSIYGMCGSVETELIVTGSD